MTFVRANSTKLAQIFVNLDNRWAGSGSSHQSFGHLAEHTHKHTLTDRHTHIHKQSYAEFINQVARKVKATSQLKGAQNGVCLHRLNSQICIYMYVLHAYIYRYIYTYIHMSCALKWQRHVRQIEKSHLDARRCLSRLKRSWNWDTDWIGRCWCCWSAAWRRQLPVAFAGRVCGEGEGQLSVRAPKCGPLSTVEPSHSLSASHQKRAVWQPNDWHTHSLTHTPTYIHRACK